jgi:uncharacterized protein (TIGR02453 family)
MEEILGFLYDLQENNNRPWFNDHKAEFDKHKNTFEEFISHLLFNLTQFDKSLVGVEAKNSIFRIYRDVRFSHNKEPYKTNFGAFLAVNGKNTNKAGYYIHIQPGGSFVGGGLYCPPAPELNAVRTAIYNQPEKFNELITAENFTSSFGPMQGDALKTAPKGFPKDFKYIELLRFKEYLAIHRLSDEDIIAPDFSKKVLQLFKNQMPFNNYLNQALKGEEF